MVTEGPKKFGHISEGSFYEKMYSRYARAAKNVAVISR